MTVYAVRQGGLGNQLFQLAAAIGLAGDGDGRLLPPQRRFLLDVEELAPGLVPGITRPDRQMVRSIPPSLQYVEPHSLAGAFAPRPHFTRRPCLISGYFQHPDWYSAALPTLVDRLLAAAPPGTMAMPTAPPVVNVRGGDYHHHGWVLPTSFYVDAARVVPLAGAVAIADDPDRGAMIATVLTATGTEVRPPQPSTPIGDFWMLATAPVVVMANSTFTWWAVHVGDELYRRAGLQRTVVFPGQWLHGEGAPLCAPTWIAV